MTTGSPSNHYGCPGHPQTPGQRTAGRAGGNPSGNQRRVGSHARRGPCQLQGHADPHPECLLDTQTGPAWVARPQELDTGYP